MAVILAEKYGEQPWILQCMNAIQEAVQNSIEMLSGQAPQHNAMPLAQGGQYAFPARTAAELQATQDQAAINGTVSPAHAQQLQALGQADAAMAGGNVDMFARLQAAAGMQDPASGQVAPQQAPSPAPTQGGAVEPAADEWIL